MKDNSPTCHICNSNTQHLFDKTLLNKYSISFYQCPSCLFIQSEEPYWLGEAYSSAIAELDIGLVYRNNLWSPIVSKIIKNYFNKEGKFLDFGGGYGLFVRLMRDRGFDFYRQDIYCENIFAKHFDEKDLTSNTSFEVLTAFEVFEHLVNPLEEIKKMFAYSPSVLFSTELQPSALKLKLQKKSLEQWHYFTPETGQHISLYNIETLKYIAKRLDKHLYSDGQYLHLLTSKKIVPFQFSYLKYERYLKYFLSKILGLKNNMGLLYADYEHIKSKL